ncbi:MAG: hypothetical protein AB7F98_01965 [Novosphingobium sp.]
MSRALNVALPQADVAALCKTAGVAVSDIETLPTGGTHLVCLTSDGAGEMRHKLKKHVIEGRVKRFAYYSPRPPR